MKNQLTLLVVSALFISLLGCGPTNEEIRIGMIPKLVGIGYFDATQRGAEEAAAELGVKLTYDGPTEARSEDQIKMIDGQ